MRVAVAIVAYRNTDDVLRCLAAVARQTHRDLLTVVCENGGAAAVEALRAALAETIPVRLIHADNPGFAGGVNRCIAASPEADAWWVLNPDTEAEPGALAELVARLERGDVDAVGGLLLNDGDRIQAAGGLWRPLLARPVSMGNGRAAAHAPDAAEVERRQHYLLGACMLVSRRFVEVAGLMREDYFLYAEEVEWALRARALGLKLGYAPGARVMHHHGTTTGAGAGRRARPRLPVYLDERNKLHVVRDTRPALLPIAAAGALLAIGLRYGARGAVRQTRYALSGWLAGLRGERGKPGWLA